MVKESVTGRNEFLENVSEGPDYERAIEQLARAGQQDDLHHVDSRPTWRRR